MFLGLVSHKYGSGSGSGVSFSTPDLHPDPHHYADLFVLMHFQHELLILADLTSNAGGKESGGFEIFKPD
jgi:hypothetical protein